MPKVNRDILIWARETARLSEEEAVKKLGLSGADRLKELEAGERDPSRRQLVNMSEKCHRPLLTFYLQTRPRERDKGRDFRTLSEGPTPGSEARLDALLRDVQARQGLIRAALEEAEEDEPLAFVGSAIAGETGFETLRLPGRPGRPGMTELSPGIRARPTLLGALRSYSAPSRTSSA